MWRLVRARSSAWGRPARGRRPDGRRRRSRKRSPLRPRSRGCRPSGRPTVRCAKSSPALVVTSSKSPPSYASAAVALDARRVFVPVPVVAGHHGDADRPHGEDRQGDDTRPHQEPNRTAGRAGPASSSTPASRRTWRIRVASTDGLIDWYPSHSASAGSACSRRVPRR